MEYDQIYTCYDSIVLVKERKNFFLNTKNFKDLIYFEKPSGRIPYDCYVFNIDNKLGFIQGYYTSPVVFDFLKLVDVADYALSFQYIFYKQENQFGMINERHQRIDLMEMFEKFDE